MAPVAPHLEPLVHPISLFPTYTASKQESFIMKVTNEHMSRDHRAIHFVDPQTGRLGQLFMEVDQPNRDFVDKSYVFIDSASGKDMMRIDKENHNFSPDIYRASAMGRQMWTLEIKERMFSGDDYFLTLYPENSQPMNLTVGHRVAGRKKAIMLNGLPVATTDQPEKFSHIQREDVIHVAQGFDILVALGVAYCHAEKQREKQRRSRGAAGGAGGGGAC